MVSSYPEPEWDEEQLELVEAERVIRVNTGQNGEWLPDATNDDLADPMNYSGLRYVGEGPYTNWAEKAYAEAVDQYKRDHGKEADMTGLYFTVRAVDER